MKCSKCSEDIHISAPHEVIDGSVLCGDCAFINGYISEDEYLKYHLFFIESENLRAAVYNGKIYVTTGMFPWEHTSRSRGCKANTEWRKAVFERDNYTCRKCGKRGGELNAHHIRPYARFPNLRYEIDNGMTLCKSCHKEYHKIYGSK